MNVSVTKVNHRYRGQPELHKHNLSVQQINHDLISLYNIICGSEYNNTVGQIDKINANMQRLVNWKILRPDEPDVAYANVPLSTKINDVTYTVLPLYSIERTNTNNEIMGLTNRLEDIRNTIENIYSNM
jgi:hypothetical protein